MKQRTPEWYAARRCKITASRFGDVLAKPTTKRYQAYLQEVVDEILGVPDFSDEAEDKPWFEHGKLWEPEARGRYEWETGRDVEEVGLIVHPKYDFIGVSLDGIVGTNGTLEIKCRKSLKAQIASERAGIDSTHVPQVKGGLWCAEREWCDFVSYYKGRDKNGKVKTLIHIHRVGVDTEYNKRLEEACLRFWDEIQEAVKREENSLAA